MKGVLLAGGTGSRLYPLTKVTNKHLLPVYHKPMIYFPLYAFKEAGITDVFIVSGRGHCGDVLELLGSGQELGMNLAYEVQEEAGGIAQALGLARDFVGNDKFVVILGDNVFESGIKKAVNDFAHQPSGAKIFLKEVDNPSSYGVATVEDDLITAIVEKPEVPESNLAVLGCYMYDYRVFDVIETLKPSARNELEITDVNTHYLEKGQLTYEILDGFWGDCGESFEGLHRVATLVKNSRLAKLDDFLLLNEREAASLNEAKTSEVVAE